MKIRHKLLLLLVGTALVSSLLVGIGAARLLRDAVGESYIERIRVETAFLAASAASRIPPTDPEQFAMEASRRLEVRVTLIGPDGRVLGDSSRSAEDLGGMENHLRRPEILAASSGAIGEAHRTSKSTGVEYFYTAMKVEGGGPVAFARIAVPSHRTREVQARYAWLVTGLSFAGLVCLSAIAYFAVGRLSKPIEAMSDTAERTAAGNLSLEVPYDGVDEIATLAASLNRMKRVLVQKIAELDAERGLLRSVVAGIREGLLLVGPDRRIEMANEAFRQIFSVPFDPVGRLLAESVRNPAVIRDLDRALEERTEIRELVLRAADSGRSFEVHVSPVPSREAGGEGGALVLFFDITRLLALENVRREFVADVSHELRTPLTSIKAFVETLLDGGLDDREHSTRFLEIARRHADRMESLIDDLTDLSLIETGAVDLEFQEVDAAALGREVAAQLAPRHASSTVSIRIDLPEPFPLRADPRRLEQILVNLIDNAIKFNRPNGTVRVTGGSGPDGHWLAVEDTGVGIPADSLEKIFNRFYRVDRARSRDLGGTGLGLAIVKHLVRLHGGTIRAESELGRGSRFVIDLPEV